MSTIKVNNIESSTGGGVAAKLASVNGGFIGTKNLIINGSCIVAQRGASSTSDGMQTVDRITYFRGGTDETPTQAQADVAAGTTPYSLGFRKCFKITNGNQTSGAGAADYVWLRYVVEDQDIATSGWNYTSSSSFITLSFWVKSSVSQVFNGVIRSLNGTSQMYPISLGSLTANTWTKITKTIPGNSNITFNNDNSAGLAINIFPFFGTNYTDNATTENAWAVYNGSARAKDSVTTWYTTNDATFEVTGLQLEVGSVATDFEHRSYAQELQLCKRYFQVAGGTHWGATEGNASYRLQVPLEPEMRANPTVTVRSGHKFNTRDQSDVTITNPTKSATSAKTRNIWTTVTSSGLTAGRPIMGRSQEGDLGDYLACDAEL